MPNHVAPSTTPTRQDRLRSAPALFEIATMIWGSTWLFIKVGLVGVPPFWGAGLRFVISAVLVGAMLAFRRTRLALTRNDKICIVIKTRDLGEYRKFLPRGTMFDKLTDLVFFYIGHRLEFDVKLLLPARHAPAARLGVSGELGWTAWIAPNNDAGDDVYFDDARFNALERRRVEQSKHRRQRQSG